MKVIREKARRTPKICLDFCNTDLGLLNQVKEAILSELGIESSVTSQDGKPPRKTAYHLRIYRKDDIAKFLVAIPTTKLTEEKRPLVEAWLAKRGRESPMSRLSQA